MNILRNIIRTAVAVLLVAAAVSCNKHKTDPVDPNRNVLLFYECGFNSLASALDDNMNSETAGLPAGFIPAQTGNVLLVYSRIARSNYNYTPVKSYLRRIYKRKSGRIVSDTLLTFNDGVIASSSSTLREVLEYTKENFQGRGYGLVISSHGSGWLPTGYYFNPKAFEKNHAGEVVTSSAANRPALGSTDGRLPVPEGTLAETDPFYGKTRSICQDEVKNGGTAYEMSVGEVAEAITYHLDYLLFDMCLTGGVEVAYGLKDKASYIGLSPAEVLDMGMYDYTKIASFLIGGTEPDLEGLFKDSFDRYDKESGWYRSATVNLVRTDGLDNLAEVTARLIDEYADTLAKAPTSRIQGYFRNSRHYFYDLVDIFTECGASEADIEELQSAVDGCVVYKNATPSFLGDFDINTYSGFSMYLPCAGTALLDTYYRKEAWNEAVKLVK